MANGFSLLELLFVVTALVTALSIAAPGVLATIDEHRAAGAVRYISGRIQRTRMEAISRSANTAMLFAATDDGYTYATYVDGNGDGVRTADITTAVDRSLGPVERLADNFLGVEIGVLPGLPAVESGSPPPGDNPVRFGAGNLLSYSPTGSSTSGSLYVQGRYGIQYVIRVAGDTGRTRILKFDARNGRWTAL